MECGMEVLQWDPRRSPVGVLTTFLDLKPKGIFFYAKYIIR